MRFSINAATTVTLRGERYLHGWMVQQFRDGRYARPALIASARQFSAFVLLLGTLTSNDSFEPKHAMLVQNKVRAHLEPEGPASSAVDNWVVFVCEGCGHSIRVWECALNTTQSYRE